MRYGFRKPSFSKSFRGATTGAFKRRVKRSVNPFYGRKGMGYLHNPRRAIYNGVYHRTTRSTHPYTAPSRTRAYRHAYYMKRKYGYVPNNSNNTFNSGKTLDDTNWYQIANKRASKEPSLNEIHKQDKHRNLKEAKDNTQTYGEKASNYRNKKHNIFIIKIIELINKIL